MLTFATLVFSSAFVLGETRTASACVCLAPSDDRNAVARSDAAFIGKLVKIEKPPDIRPTNLDGSPMGALVSNLLTFRVSRVFKGQVTRTQEILTPFASSCGITLDQGRRYAVLAYDPSQNQFLVSRPGQYATDQCSGAHVAGRALRGVPEGRRPARDSNSVDDAFFPYGTLADGDRYSCAQPFLGELPNFDQWFCIRLPKDGEPVQGGFIVNGEFKPQERVFPPGAPR